MTRARLLLKLRSNAAGLAAKIRTVSDFIERCSIGFIAILFSILIGIVDLKTSVEIHFLLLYLTLIFGVNRLLESAHAHFGIRSLRR